MKHYEHAGVKLFAATGNDTRKGFARRIAATGRRTPRRSGSSGGAIRNGIPSATRKVAVSTKGAERRCGIRWPASMAQTGVMPTLRSGWHRKGSVTYAEIPLPRTHRRTWSLTTTTDAARSGRVATSAGAGSHAAGATSCSASLMRIQYGCAA